MTFLTCSTWEFAEEVDSIAFGEQDVLPTVHERMKRLACLMKAISLEGMSSSPVTLWVEGKEFCVRITSRVIAASNHQIILENGIRLPISSIHLVEFQGNGEACG